MVAIVEANIGRCCMCRDIGALENELGKLGYDVPAWFGKRVREWMAGACSTCQTRIDEARAETKQIRADYMMVADAVARESQSPDELAEIARQTRRKLNDWRDSGPKLLKALAFVRGILDDADAEISWNNRKAARDSVARGMQVAGSAIAMADKSVQRTPSEAESILLDVWAQYRTPGTVKGMQGYHAGAMSTLEDVQDYLTARGYVAEDGSFTEITDQ